MTENVNRPSDARTEKKLPFGNAPNVIFVLATIAGAFYDTAIIRAKKGL